MYHAHSQGTASPNVFVLSQDFFIPQLHRHRRIWVYLPPDYDQSGKHYPVIYMQDGQNLFDAHISFSGEWRVDKTLNRLHRRGDHGAIVVGIDNGGEHRVGEYAPWARARMGGGEGEKYADFLAHTLKPFIDHHFRTRPGREHTAVMGSSMGGLIATYTGLRHADKFAKIGAFSPAYWFNSQLYDWAAHQPKPGPMHLVMVGSRTESIYMQRNMEHLYQSLQQAGYDHPEITAVVRERGKHNEQFWGREFAFVYQTLFGKGAPTRPKPPAARKPQVR
jgi:predicted alpha/beta superfamily hydrolase